MSRSTLKPVISKLREIIIKDIAGKMEKFGFDLEAKISVEKPTSDYDGMIRNNLIHLFEAKKTSGNKDDYIKYIQDSARTFLHIIICFKTMERRGLMGRLLSQLLDGNSYDNVLPNFNKVLPLAFTDLAAKYESEIDDLEQNDRYEEDRDYYEFIYIIDLISKEMAKEVPLLFKDYEHALVIPDFAAIKDMLFAIDNIEDDEYFEDDFLGWIYQYWVDIKKEELKIAKNEAEIGYKETIYYEILKKLEIEQTQYGEFYTPRWVVKYIVDNTLKPYYEENKNIQTIKLLDPACGAGNFLVYSFDVFYEIYKQEYPNRSESAIIQSILKNNIFGVDIQREPLQISALNLWLKAKRKAADAKIENINLFNFNILMANSLYRWENDVVNVQLSLFEEEIKLTERHYSTEDIGEYISAQKRFAQHTANQFFSNKFHVIVMNPPFVDARNMDGLTSRFLKKEYPSNSRNLFSAFIERGIELNLNKGFIGFICSDTFMTISSFENIRKLMLTKQIKQVTTLGGGVFDGPTVSSSIMIIKNLKLKNNIINYINKQNDQISQKNILQSKLYNISSSPFIFNLSDDFIKIFKNKTIDNYRELFEVRKGIVTAFNEVFLKYKWEVPKEKIGRDFLLYNKDINNYFYDVNQVLDWRKSTQTKILANKSSRCAYILDSFNNNENNYKFRSGVIFNLTGGLKACILNSQLFDVSFPAILIRNDVYQNYILALMCSKLSKYILNLLNTTIHTTPGDVRNLPYISIEEELCLKFDNIVDEICELKKKLLSFTYTAQNYIQSEIEYGLYYEINVINGFLKYQYLIESINNRVYYLQSILDDMIYELYSISEDDIKIIENSYGSSAYIYEPNKNKVSNLKPKEFMHLYTNELKNYPHPLSIIEIAELKQMNPDDVLELRKEYGIYREKDLKTATLNYLRAIVKDTIITNEPKLYEDIEIENIIKKHIENNFDNGYLLIDEIEGILGKDILGVIRGGTKIGSSNVTLAGKGSKDLSEPLLQQKVLGGTGKNKRVILWHLTQFLLEFEENKKYVMQRNISEINDTYNNRIEILKEKLLSASKSDKKDIEKQLKLLLTSAKTLNNWKVL